MSFATDTDLAAKQKYFEYSMSEGGSWWLKTAPIAEPWFQEELIELAGLHDGRRPRLRVVWGGSVMHDMTEKPQLKYQMVREVNDGYHYAKQDGTVGVCRSMNLPDDAVIPWRFAPKMKRVEFGRLRWVIEKHVSAEELERTHRFEHRKAPNGETILRELPPEGIYQHYFWVQTAGGKYRDLDREVMTAIQAMYLYHTTTSEAQQALDADEQDQKRTLMGAAEAREVWEDLRQSKIKT